MSEMVERVARAIAMRESQIMFGADPATQAADPRELARAAIEAMRDPTNEMAEVGAAAATTTQRGAWFGWKAMINAALTQPKPAATSPRL